MIIYCFKTKHGLSTGKVTHHIKLKLNKTHNDIKLNLDSAGKQGCLRGGGQENQGSPKAWLKPHLFLHVYGTECSVHCMITAAILDAPKTKVKRKKNGNDSPLELGLGSWGNKEDPCCGKWWGGAQGWGSTTACSSHLHSRNTADWGQRRRRRKA